MDNQKNCSSENDPISNLSTINLPRLSFESGKATPDILLRARSDSRMMAAIRFLSSIPYHRGTAAEESFRIVRRISGAERPVAEAFRGRPPTLSATALTV